MQRLPLTIAAAAVFLINKPALGQDQSEAPLPVHFVSLPIGPRAPLGAVAGDTQAGASPTIPLWNGTISGFAYSMVGQNPQFALTGQTTFVVTPIIPIVFVFADGSTFDPTAPDSTCLGGNSAAGLTMASPLFNNYNFTAGGTNVGPATQYLDFYQRANFWQYTNPSGANPNYHLLLSPIQFAPIRISVPAANGRAIKGYCGGKLGEVEINWFDSYVTYSLFPQLASMGVLPSNLPVFLTHNVIMYDTSTSNCCILGYHTAFYNPRFGNAMQTYAVAEFDSSGAFGSSTRDVSALSHEIGEWVDDPLANNQTPPWGNVGQVSGCQSDLENGDPLTGTGITATMLNGFTYHLQELAFFSWFYNQTPSLGVNGWYSSNGKFKTPAVPCGSTPRPVASLNVSSLDFPPQSVGTSSSAQTITLTNTGNATLSGIAISLTGINPGDFALANNCAASLAANSSCSVSVTFKPTGVGARSATASFSDNATGSPQTAALTGTGTGTLQATVSTGSLTFGSQNVQTASPVQSVTVTNTGSGALAFTAISVTGANPGDFSQTSNCLAGLAAGASCAISVTFQPTAVGLRSAVISIADNAVGSPQTVALTGTGAGTPQVSLSAGSLMFASQTVGSSSSAQAVTLMNIGTAALTFTAISVTGANAADFIQTNNCVSGLAAGASCSIAVTFQPTAAGLRAASISIGDNAPGSSQTVSLSGTGAIVSSTPQVTLSASNLTFSSQNLGTSVSQSVTVANTGNGPLSVAGISVTGANAGDFAQSNNCPASLASNASCSITITFTPSAAGTRSATVAISDNANGAPQSVGLTGTGSAAAALQPYISSVSHLVVPANQTTSLIVSGFNFQDGFTASVTTPAGTVSLPGSAMTFLSATQVQVSVTPPGPAPYLATLTITNPGGLKASTQIFVLSF